MTRSDSLPVDNVVLALARALADRGVAVLTAAPGAGKTTRVPLALLHEAWLGKGKIVMLEPRRLAARAAAKRMAATLGEDVGETVGYRVRFEHRTSAQTRIEVVTEGVLLTALQRDPALSDAALLIFDEFHERSLEGDLGLALAWDARQALRPDLRLLVMSATLDAGVLATRLGGASVIEAPGRMFPVEVRHRPRGPRTRLSDDVADAVRAALRDQEGSILAFLPGEAEIRRTEAALNNGRLPDDVVVAPLYGAMPAPDQDRAIAPAPPGQRKVVLATTIAETSLTIEGIGVVVDGGYKRAPRFDPSSGMTRLETVRVSLASAEQRRGRAGRLGPGMCYRLWTPEEERAFARQDAPEILGADLAPVALELALWGARDPDTLMWIDAPPKAAFAQARTLLENLGALDAQGAITAMGRRMAALPLHPRLSHMIEAAPNPAHKARASEIAALLSERDVLDGTRDADLAHRLDAVFGARAENRGEGRVNAGARARVREAARQVRRIARVADVDAARTIGPLLALAYPDRVAERRGGAHRYRFSGGGGGLLDEADSLARHDFLAVASTDGRAGDSRIFLAAPILREEIEAIFADRIATVEEVAWDARSESVVQRRQRRLGAVVLEESRIEGADPSRVAAAMAAGVAAMGLNVLPWSEGARALQARVAFLARVRPEESWPDLSDATLVTHITEWLEPYLVGMTRRAHLARLNLTAILEDMIPRALRARLATLAPARLSVPSGASYDLDYAAPGGPKLSVRLQEMFGLAQTPRVAEGRVPVVIELLSPARRPLATTADLENFWRQVYPQVRREMRGRYPKHAWPEDPLATAPVGPRRIR